MKRLRKTLDKISGYLFMAGFITGRLKHIPMLLVSAVLNLTSMLAFMIGYVVWYMASLFYPSKPRAHQAWYGFLEFKEQYQITTLLGVVASIMCIIAPVALVPIAWLFAISNTLWTISEYHKQQNPPLDDENYSRRKQAHYVRYTYFLTLESILASVAVTLAFVFPPSALIILTTTGIVGLALTGKSLYYWAKAAFETNTPDKTVNSDENAEKKLVAKDMYSADDKANLPQATLALNDTNDKSKQGWNKERSTTLINNVKLANNNANPLLFKAKSELQDSAVNHQTTQTSMSLI